MPPFSPNAAPWGVETMRFFASRRPRFTGLNSRGNCVVIGSPSCGGYFTLASYRNSMLSIQGVQSSRLLIPKMCACWYALMIGASS